MSLQKISTDALARRIPELLRDERAAGIDFLLHLAEFDRRRAWAAAGHPTLWDYCRKELGLLDCAIWRRVRCVSVIQQFPAAAEYLRDGRFEMSTLAMLHEVLTPGNAARVLEAGAGKSRSEISTLVADLRAPRPDVREEIRKLPAAPPAAGIEAGLTTAPGIGFPESFVSASSIGFSQPTLPAPIGAAADGPLAWPAPAAPAVPAVPAAPAALGALGAPAAPGAPTRPRELPRAEFDPLGTERWALRMTVNRRFREKLERARAILSHAEPSGSLVAVLERALDRVIADHSKRVTARSRNASRAKATAARTGTVSTSAAKPAASAASAKATVKARARTKSSDRTVQSKAKRAKAPPSSGANRGKRTHIPIEVERQVRQRDGDCCAWGMRDGTRCGSTWQLELDHIVSPKHGGKNTVDNLRLLCRPHNQEHARRVFGDDAVERHKRRSGSPGRVAATP